MQTILGQKVEQTEKFLENGVRIPVTVVKAGENVVVATKTKDKHGYLAIQLGFNSKKKGNKSELGIAKGAKLEKAPRFLREARIEENEVFEPGTVIKASEVFKPGDLINVIGVSKGKGYAGVVKRHHFKGGPRTHGQSDRERAPGSIGQTTTPGRVYKGKKMAGKMGNEQVTVRNLTIADITDELILINGLVPGPKNSLLIINKVGENKKFVPLYQEEIKEEVKEEPKEEVIQEAQAPKEPEEVKEENAN